jgi:hypothetical protein
MAGYRTHITVSGALGAGYGTAGVMLAGFSPVQGALAGVLTWFSGMLPDLDSDTGKPVREVFSLLAAFAPFAMMGHLEAWSRGNVETMTLLAVLLYALIRYGGQYLLNRVSVHRGMFHSVPAMIISAEIAFLAFKSPSLTVKLLMAGGVAVGFFSHLVLDEIYAVQWDGLRVKLNKFAGSAVKLVGNRFIPNIVTYSLLMVLTYASLVQARILEPPGPSPIGMPLQRAAADEPQRL